MTNRVRASTFWGFRSVRLVFVALALACAVPACGFAKDMKAAAGLQSRIKADLGVDANVNFRTHNGVTTVFITLKSMPAGDPAATKAKVTALARSQFPGAASIVVTAAL